MTTERRIGRTNIILAFVGVVVVAIVAAISLQEEEQTPSLDDILAAHDAALASEHAPMVGDPDAKVHIVEFLDPACEACAAFYPLVKSWSIQLFTSG